MKKEPKEGEAIMEDIKQKILAYFKENAAKPLTVEEIEEQLTLDEASEFTVLVKGLNELEAEGQLVRTRSNRFGLPEKLNSCEERSRCMLKALLSSYQMKRE